eukprot:maker-scaffold30_size591359-snap-gene-2.14 protein:Tk12758 transcript:maker-scaffold30_size591359-snap-gene-2.14-mRNA-1 annotation:"e3 ubiquitin-protein ligase rnf170-like"
MTSSYLYGLGDEIIVGVILGAFLIYLGYQLYWKLIGPQVERFNGTTSSSSPTHSARMAYNGRIRSDVYECSICLGEITLAVETNCGHTFCGTCMLTFYDMANTGPLTAPNCPMCRQRITLLLPYFSEEERSSIELDVVTNRDAIMERVCQFNRRFSGESRSYREMVTDLPMLLRHLFNRLREGEGLDLFFRARAGIYLVVIALYVVMPFDILPEGVIGLIGLVDDILFAIVVLLSLTTHFRTILGDGQ